MLKLGYKLMTETHDPRDLVANARLAESAGFDFVSISDHYHPWLKSHGHSAFAWTVLGALAQATKTIRISTGLTCPIVRYHPAIVAQAAATVAVMSNGRFTLALGTGERLNEHVVGEGWPAPPERLAMLREAVEIIRLLWTGEMCSYSGAFFDVESARVHDLPDDPIPIVIGVSGEKSTALAGEIGDGIMAVEASREIVENWRKAGGGAGPRYGELALGYAASDDEGLELAHKYARFGAFDWSVLAEIPGVEGFEEATRFIRPDDLRDHVPHGPDVETYVEAVRKFTDAGFDHVVLLPLGPDQAPFIRFFENELAQRLRELEPASMETSKRERRRVAPIAGSRSAR